MAWIIGWDLILEYSVASLTVAHAGRRIPGHPADHRLRVPRSSPTRPSIRPHGRAPRLHRLLVRPRRVHRAPLTGLLVYGIRESASVNTAVVMLKVTIVLFGSWFGAFYVNPANWVPFAPFGYTGISFFGIPCLADRGGRRTLGVLRSGGVFFAYIASTPSPPTPRGKTRRRTCPSGSVVAVVCTILYIAWPRSSPAWSPTRRSHRDAGLRRLPAPGLPWARYLISAARSRVSPRCCWFMMSQPSARWLAHGPRRHGVPVVLRGHPSQVPHPLQGDDPHRDPSPWAGGCCRCASSPTSRTAGPCSQFVVVCAAVLIMRRRTPTRCGLPGAAGSVVPTPASHLHDPHVLARPRELWRLFIWLVHRMIIYFGYSRSTASRAPGRGGQYPD